MNNEVSKVAASQKLRMLGNWILKLSDHVDALERIVDVPISVPEYGEIEKRMSCRLRNCLRGDGISDVMQLIAKTPDELKEIRNFGETCLVELRGLLAEHHLKLNRD